MKKTVKKSTPKQKPTSKKVKKKKQEEVAPLIEVVQSAPLTEKEKKAQQEKLKKVMAKVNKKFGENMLILGSQIQQRELIRIPSVAIPSLDFAIGGGLPRGRVITISGPFSSCKSALGYRYVGQHQRKGHLCALVDVEGTYTPQWGAVHGIDNDTLLYYRPDTAEQALDIATMLAKEGIEFIMLDSIAALSPDREMESDLGDGGRLALAPELIGRFLRKMNAINNKWARQNQDGTTLLLINQLREKPMSMGDPEYEPGGRAIGFYSSIQIRIRRGDWIRVGTGKNQRIVGQVVKYKVTKNKTYKMLQTGEFDFYTDEANALRLPAGSFDTAKMLIVEGIAWGIIKQPSQGYFVVDSEKIHGEAKTIEAVRKRPKMASSIHSQISELIKNGTIVESALEEREVDLESGEVFD